MAPFDDSALKEIITGRVEPHIYSFETNTLPNLLKVGDTYRPVEERLDEWRRHYKDLSEVSRHKALVDENIFFRDHSVHKRLQDQGKIRAAIDRDNNIHSNEFFEDTNSDDVTEAVADVVASFSTPGKYTYYDGLRNITESRHERTKDFTPRDNQQAVIENFASALGKGRTNLLMYAVMRFGKSITSMWCAKEIDSKLTIVVSAKADVKDEWKQTVESHKDFTGYQFMDGSKLAPNTKLADTYGQEFKTGSGETEICTNIVIFFTLQDLAGSTDEIKQRHLILEDANPDLLIIDETHFGARAQVLGKILAGVELTEEDEEAFKQTDGVDDLGRIGKLESISAKVNLHLSGTPYRILMGSEFEQEDIIAFVQFSDIYESKIEWQQKNLDQEEWHNPYYGFPQMIRFAFNPNERSRKKLELIPGSKPSEIFAPVDTTKNGDYETFKHEAEAIELLQVLDGSKHDTQLLGLLDHESIKAGKLARHIVIVLPNKASCDAFEKLVTERGELFKNISEYEILNIAGLNTRFRTVKSVKEAVEKADPEDKKTITLTVNKMLTGTTVPQWDTMLYLKATISPQEYDQAIFRLQSPWVKTYTSETGDVIKYDMKPQTLLVDLDPTRLFYLQEVKAFTYGANVQSIGNENIEKFIKRELKVSPVLALNAENNKLIEIEASVIIDAVRKYASERSIADDVKEIGVDVSLRDNEDIHSLISKLSEISGKAGLSIAPISDEEGDDLDGEDNGNDTEDSTDEGGSSSASSSSNTPDSDAVEIKTFEKQFRMYYVLILLFAFLSTTEEKSLTDVIENLDANDDNIRIARSLGLTKEHLISLREHINFSILSSLDYKIQNSDYRSYDESISPVEHINIAINKFGKLSDSEVFTPAPIVDKIYDSFDEAFWENSASAKILDIASKSGSFASGFVNRAAVHGVATATIKNNFYSIPTSPAAYEFTRKMYEALGLNIDNIAQHFTSYDILELRHSRAITILMEQKKLSEISKEDLKATDDKIDSNENEGDEVKFDAIVGNPPYQREMTGTSDSPIYDKFINSSYSLSDKVVMIHPARFLFGAGKTPKAWNKKMLEDDHIEVVEFNQKSSEIFPNTDIKGGIVITHRDTSRQIGPIGTFIPYKELRKIVAKVEAKNSQGAISEIVYSPESYKLTRLLHSEYPSAQELMSKGHTYDLTTNIFTKLPMIFKDSVDAIDGESVAIFGRQDNTRIHKWISRKYISQHPNLDKYKLFVAKSNGTGTFGEVLSTPLISKPGVGHNQSFISIGAFETRLEATSALKYVRSKFARTMLSVMKITQDNKKNSWSKVPLQDFTAESDIDWSKSIPEIDQQLYKKYSLGQEEIDFIESRVKAME